MKRFLPISLAILLTACAITPEDKQAAHQRELWKEAHDNFMALKAQEHPNRPPAPEQRVAAESNLAPASKPTLLASIFQPAPAPARKAAPTPKAAPTGTAQRKSDDTVYFWQVAPPAQKNNLRYSAAEVKYARLMAKRPEDLTPEERIWAHEHY